MRILIVDDEDSVGVLLRNTLEASGFTTDLANTGDDALYLVQNYAFDLVVLDMNLPDMSGFQVIQKMRATRISTPVLAISGDGSDERITRSFAAGADDFLAKPYRQAELVARIKAIVRRTRGFASAQLQLGDLVVDIDKREAAVKGTKIELTKREYQLLELLALRRGNTITKSALLDSMYGGLDEPDPKIIDVFVCKIRKKIDTITDGASIIVTDWGRGYRTCRQECDPRMPLIAAAA